MFLNGAGSEFRIERRVYSEARNCRPQWRRTKKKCILISSDQMNSDIEFCVPIDVAAASPTTACMHQHR